MKAAKSRKRNGRATGYNPDPNDDKILWENMDRLMRKYPRGWAVVCGGELFAGKKLAPLDKRARQNHPGITPLIARIPSEKDLMCVL